MSPASYCNCLFSDVIFWHLFYSCSALLLPSNSQKSYSLLFAINAAGKGEAERLLAKLQGISYCPAGHPHGYDPAAWGMVMLRCLGLSALRHLVAALSHLLGNNHRQGALASLCAKQTSAIITFLFIGNVSLDFHGDKSADICCTNWLQANPNIYFKSEVAGAGRRSWYFTSGREKAATHFFLSLGPRNGQIILTEAFGVWGKNQLITDAHCVKFNSKLLKNCKHNFSRFYGWCHHFVLIKQ